MTDRTHGDIEQDTKNLIDEIQQLFLNAANRRTMQTDLEKQNILENCKNSDLTEAIRDLTVISFHILDAIGRNEPINSTAISQKTDIPKGTVSKNISKLLSYHLITKNNIPDNKKESVFQLTPAGMELYVLHGKMHQRMEQKITGYFKRYSIHDLEFLVQFLHDYVNGAWEE